MGDHDYKPIKCPRCNRTAIKLIKEGLFRKFKDKYPDGVCHYCKKAYINHLKKLMEATQ